jgi:hypothetical protein
MKLSRSMFVVCLLTLAAADRPALRVSGVSGRDGVTKTPVAFTLTDLAGLPRTSAKAPARDGTDRLYEGVLLPEILKRAGQPFGEELRGSLLSKYVIVTAHDGYRVLFSLPEIDPAFTDARIILADKLNGKPLPDREGPLRLVIPAEKREARWTRMVEQIEVVAAPEPIR